MDDLSNYIGLLPSVRASKEEQDEKAKTLSDEMKERVKAFTTPIGETFMADAGQSIIKQAGSTLANKLRSKGLPIEHAERYAKAYKDGGIKGVVKEGIKDLRGEAPVKEQAIKDLSPEEYHSIRRTIEQAQIQRFESYPQNVQNSIERKFRNERIMPQDQPNSKIMNRDNAQKMNDIMDEYEQRQQAFEGQNPLQRNLPFSGDDDDSLLENTQRTISGVKKIVPQAVGDIEKEGENVAKKGVKLAEKVASKVAETEAETGGPEDIVGDVVSGLVGLGALITGIKIGKHIHQQTPNDLISNATYQAGA